MDTLQSLAEAFVSWLDRVGHFSCTSVREVFGEASSGVPATELSSVINELLLSGGEECFECLDEYIRIAADLTPLDETQLEPRYLLDDIDRLFGVDASGESFVGYYADHSEVVGAHSLPGAQLLVPFVCALFRPVDPWMPWRETERLLLEAMDRLVPASLPDLVATVLNSGGFISEAYLRLKIMNSTAFLSFGCGTASPLYAATAQVLPHFALAACGIETDPNGPPVDLLPQRFLNFFCRWSEVGYIPHLDQAEILAKLTQYRRGQRNLVQGLDPSLHEAIVETLNRQEGNRGWPASSVTAREMPAPAKGMTARAFRASTRVEERSGIAASAGLVTPTTLTKAGGAARRPMKPAQGARPRV